MKLSGYIVAVLLLTIGCAGNWKDSVKSKGMVGIETNTPYTPRYFFELSEDYFKASDKLKITVPEEYDFVVTSSDSSTVTFRRRTPEETDIKFLIFWEGEKAEYDIKIKKAVLGEESEASVSENVVIDNVTSATETKDGKFGFVFIFIFLLLLITAVFYFLYRKAVSSLRKILRNIPEEFGFSPGVKIKADPILMRMSDFFDLFAVIVAIRKKLFEEEQIKEEPEEQPVEEKVEKTINSSTSEEVSFVEDKPDDDTVWLMEEEEFIFDKGKKMYASYVSSQDPLGFYESSLKFGFDRKSVFVLTRIDEYRASYEVVTDRSNHEAALLNLEMFKIACDFDFSPRSASEEIINETPGELYLDGNGIWVINKKVVVSFRPDNVL